MEPDPVVESSAPPDEPVVSQSSQAWNPRTLSSWPEFYDLLVRQAASGGSPLRRGLAFRGQGRSDWGLVPTLTRLALQVGLSRAEAHETEADLLRNFRSRAHLWLTGSIVPAGAEAALIHLPYQCWWPVMQHFGAPTRLLDWTASPLVGLYFAVSSDWDHDGALWAVQVSSLNRAVAERPVSSSKPKPTDKEKAWFALTASDDVTILDSLQPNERMIAQRAFFTVANDVLTDHRTILAALMPELGSETKPGHFTLNRMKFVIPKEAKPELLRHLNVMNVTAATLFPGIDGLGREMAELVRLSGAGTQP